MLEVRIVSSIAAVAATCAVVLAVASAPGAAASSTRAAWTRAHAPESISAELADVARAERQNGRGLDKARALGLEVSGDRVRVVAEAAGAPSAVVAATEAAGGNVEASHADLLQALVPPASLAALALAHAVERVRTPHRPLEQAIIGEEVAGSAASVFHNALWKGEGVEVAIIDAGFAGLAARQSAGEIPAAITTVDLCGGGFGTSSVHGTAVAEIVHEVAPEAELHLICVNSEVTLGQAKEYAKTNGIGIVNMSLAFLNSGRGDGSGGPSTPDGIVADARASGILWINAAGNYARRHWSGAFSDTDGDDFHNFTPTDGTNTIVVGPGQKACVYLKWNDWPLSDQDFDLFLYRLATGQMVASSTNDQTTTTTPPTETLCYTSTFGAADSFGISIHRFDATDTPRFDLISASHDLEHVVPAGSVVEPASSSNAMAVGAVCFADGSLRSYSSLGPTIDGRTKPDVAGLDGVSTATFGTSSGCSSGYRSTSASAALVAGLAALGKEQNPSLTAAQLQTWLGARAQDIAPSGKDNSTGWGRAWVYSFTDTPPWTGLQPFVEQLFRKGVTTGCSSLVPSTGVRSYCPDQSVTRDQMAVFIIRALGLSPLTPTTPTFTDVPTSYWAFGFIERLFAQGITTGCASSPPRYCPLDPVRRDQMAAFLVRAKGLTQLDPGTPTFADVPKTSPFYGYVERLFQQGVTTGCSAGPPRLYCPADAVTRRQMAAFLIRAFGPPTT